MHGDDITDNLWDDHLVRNDDPIDAPISRVIRLIHFIADVAAAVVIYNMLLFGAVYLFTQTGQLPNWIESRSSMALVLTSIYLIYCWFMEAFAGGQTLGKLITRHRVVRNDLADAGLYSVTIRTAVRLIPLNFISIFFNRQGHMWHDRWSGTRLIRL
jgi:uncharacterized RDD family membrane protein YckC